MGTIHYLIDDEGKNALCVQKWYALSPERWDDVTDADLDAARECEKVGDEFAGVLTDTAKAWRRDVAKGRTIRLVTDNAELYPWQNEDYTKIHGWTVYEVDGEGGWVVDFTTTAYPPLTGDPPDMLDSARAGETTFMAVGLLLFAGGLMEERMDVLRRMGRVGVGS